MIRRPHLQDYPQLLQNFLLQEKIQSPFLMDLYLVKEHLLIFTRYFFIFFLDIKFMLNIIYHRVRKPVPFLPK